MLIAGNLGTIIRHNLSTNLQVQFFVIRQVFYIS